MSTKRTRSHSDADDTDDRRKRKTDEQFGQDDDEEDLVFEDPFADDMEDEEEVIDDDNNMEDYDMEEDSNREYEFWQGDEKDLNKDEQLEYDSSAYEMFHKLQVDWPCLSFDIIPDKEGLQRTRFPLTSYFVAGTQADQASQNKLVVMKASDLHRTKNDENSDDEDEDIDDLDDDPILEHHSIQHKGAVNRVKVMPQKPNIVATWSEQKKVHLWDISQQISKLTHGAAKATTTKGNCCVYTFNNHADEGYALAWNNIKEGTLISGDCASKIHIWNAAHGTWVVDSAPFVGHTSSVEDLQWSPSEPTVFASASADTTIRIWDSRKKTGSALTVQAHDEDVNVLSWNKVVQYLLVSGSDDGTFKIWDLRSIKQGEPVANFKWHKGPITSVEWNPNEESVVAVASDDNKLTLWDLSLEKDEETEGVKVEKELPPQLLFIHQGQKHIKEVHWHAQIPGYIHSTASNGFNIFKTINS